MEHNEQENQLEEQDYIEDASVQEQDIIKIEENIEQSLQGDVQAEDGQKKEKTFKLKAVISEMLLYAGIFLVVFLITRYVVKLDKVDGPSMNDTLHDGDYGLMSMVSKINRGDVIIFQGPGEEEGVYYIKRVIGIGGDEVTIDGNKVYVNRNQIEENYIKEEDFNTEKEENQTVYVPEGEFFCMGDNRNESYDGRAFGTIKEKDVLGEWLFKIINLKRIFK